MSLKRRNTSACGLLLGVHREASNSAHQARIKCLITLVHTLCKNILFLSYLISSINNGIVNSIVFVLIQLVYIHHEY